MALFPVFTLFVPPIPLLRVQYRIFSAQSCDKSEAATSCYMYLILRDNKILLLHVLLWLYITNAQCKSVSSLFYLRVNTFVFVCFVLAALHQHCYVCEHLAVRVYHLLRRTQVLRRVTNFRKREKFLVNQVFPGETGGMRAVATLFRATITPPSQTAPTSLSPSG